MEERKVPVFQLLQWKYAIKLEMAELKHSRGSVWVHAKRVLQVKGSRESVIAHIDGLLKEAEDGGK